MLLKIDLLNKISFKIDRMYTASLKCSMADGFFFRRCRKTFVEATG